MKIKRMVKRLFAVGAGATMLGATAMGAMAANLSDYPTMFVTDGEFNGFFVVGENAAAVDNLAMTDIASNMRAPLGESTTTVVEGDAWLVRSGSDVLEFSESIGPAAEGVVDFLDGNDLEALKNGKLTSSQGSFDYEQYLRFHRAVVNVTYTEDDDDNTDLFLRILDNQQFAQYELNFLEAAESDIDASESFELDDYEGKGLSMFGKTYDIVKAVTGGANSPQLTLTLMAGSATDTMLEGEVGTYTVEGVPYEIEVVFTNTNSQAKFNVNGQTTPLMDEGDTETLGDGTVFGLSEVLHQDFAGGVHSAEFFVGADKIVLQDDDITLSSTTDEVQVNDETIDGADVIIEGSIMDNATSTTEDGELEIDRILVNITSQEDYYVAAGETLSGQPEFDEKGLLFGDWDIRFEGMDSVETDTISVVDKSGEREYQVTFTNVNGDSIQLPLAYASGTTAIRLGDTNDRLWFNHTAIPDEGFFILNDDSDEDSVSQVVQYKGASDIGESNPQMKFKVLASGETVQRPITFGAGVNGATATLSLAGTTYTFANSSDADGAGGGSVNADDWNITITGGDVVTEGYQNNSGRHISNDFVITRGGGKIWMEAVNYTEAGAGSGTIYFNISLIDSDRINDVIDTDNDGSVADQLPYLLFSANISVASQEVDFTGVGGLTLTSPDDDSDNSYGYGANGAFLHRNSPSGGGTSADTITIEWPREIRTPQVYVTSGAVETSTSSTGPEALVTVPVGSTKLDSEIASVEAQNLVVVGGPCVNTVAAELLGNPADCTEGFQPGVSRVKLWEHASGNVAMLVAGYSGRDTRLAGAVIAARGGSELSGMEVEVSGTTHTDAVISAPSAAPVADEE